jgi:peptidoglycan/xylan/chitin deacetylase (PgdA/CDA1 family)
LKFWLASAFLPLLILAPAGAQTAAQTPAYELAPAELGPVQMRSYTQTIRMTFQSEAAAQQARLRILPLYHDYRAGFSTRWDDSNVNDLRAAEVMAKFGQTGTFYLNSLNSWYQDNKATGIILPADPAAEIPRALLAGGNSLGGHTLNHEMLPALSKNAAFKEILGVRVAIESQAASPVLAFVYPFVFFQSPLRQGVDQADLEEMLRRSGYYMLGEDDYNQSQSSDFFESRFIIIDGNASDTTLSNFLQSKDHSDDRPLFLVTMHAWVAAWGGPDFPKLADIYKKWSGRNDLWYTTQNHYAAYRYQALYSRLNVTVAGKVLTAQLQRPDPIDLDDWTPLTFSLDGVSKPDVVSVDSPGAEVKPVALPNSYAFDLYQDHNRGTIDSYAESDNPSNSDKLAATKGSSGNLHALLFRRGPLLSLTLRNDSAQPVSDIRVAFRLPLRWQQGVIHKQLNELPPGASITLQESLSERPDPAQYSDGLEYDVAQVDYRGQSRSRLYAVAEVKGEDLSPSFARNGFLILGPMPGDIAGFDAQAFANNPMQSNPPAHNYTLPSGETLTWRTLDSVRASILDPDIIPTTGRSNIPNSYSWDRALYNAHTGLAYLLYGRIVSPQAQTVQASYCKDCVKQLFLNGQVVPGPQLALRQGVNDLRILYKPTMATMSDYTENNYGCYFRLTGSDGKRIEDVQFEKPPQP